MATNPYFSPYHTQRFSFIGSPQQRDGTYEKDQRFLNLYPELIKSPITDGKKYYLKKRPGLTQFEALPGGNAQGLFLFPGNNQFYAAIGGILYANTTPILTLTQSTSPVGFCEFRSDSEDILFVCDGGAAWTISGTNVVTGITGTNLPIPHIAAPVFLDGYIFLAQLHTQTIWNSALQDPLTWPADGFIDAEMYPDSLVTLTKSQNYLACIGTESIEFMYDNANATGSPLQRNAPAVSQFGSPNAQLTVCQTETEVILVGSTGNGGRTVWIIEGFQPKEIANEPVREALDLEGTSIAGAYAYVIQCAGHKWYILNLIGNQRTFVFDFEETMWHEWTSGTTQAVFPWIYAADSLSGTPVFLHATNGLVTVMSPTLYDDVGVPINCVATTSKIDFDTIYRKRFYRLSLIGDSPNGDISTPVAIDWSDDDYNTWVGNFIIQLNGDYPTVTQLGYSRRRAFRFTYQQPFALRLEAFEVDIIQEVRR